MSSKVGLVSTSTDGSSVGHNWVMAGHGLHGGPSEVRSCPGATPGVTGPSGVLSGPSGGGSLVSSSGVTLTTWGGGGRGSAPGIFGAGHAYPLVCRPSLDNIIVIYSIIMGFIRAIEAETGGTSSQLRHFITEFIEVTYLPETTSRLLARMNSALGGKHAIDFVTSCNVAIYVCHR
ncbi:unnamed protein product [Protopolystoma xenopodis]|uniref:Uncharacterized protein n=1 Tax=Protopolystoma xenopodis TaxID=117903 RepID=A0A3S5CDR9_9PLAT|nr:unnamed protein product [Protopolystoma xenopodis]